MDSEIAGRGDVWNGGLDDTDDEDEGEDDADKDPLYGSGAGDSDVDALGDVGPWDVAGMGLEEDSAKRSED